MIVIPGELIALLTFPGIICHELGHMIMCKATNTQIIKVCYFRVGNPAGYVTHVSPASYNATFFIGVAPFIFNTGVAIFIFALVSIITNIGVDWFLVWVGFSIAMHSFPSSGDAQYLWSHSLVAWKHSVLAMFGFPIVILIRIANILSVVWFDAIYAYLLTIPFLSNKGLW